MEPVVERNRFFLGDQVVGYFDGQVPTSPGLYQYVPYRGPGHLRLVQSLASIGPQRCYYAAEGKVHYFMVERISSLHVLQVSG